ncbi:MAG: ABC transporter ATP-binding protein [Planctomycetes bacterium]|nr:ABC transporter ATP-binding protein [Planctomycetota bacterium]
MISSDEVDVASLPDPGQSVIRAHALTRYFGNKCAVNGVSFSVPRGSVCAFIGRNGAGKSTTIRMLLGLLAPTRGRSMILGHDSLELPPETRARIGYMAEGHPVYPWMRVSQYGTFQKGFYRRWNQGMFSSIIDYFAIAPRTKAGELSHGQRAGLHLAMTLASEPELLVLDEPDTGLDPAARRSLLEAMIHFTRNRERTILFSTHLLDDVERMADHVMVLDYSVLRVACSVDLFRDHVRRVLAQFSGPPPRELPDIRGLLRATAGENDLTLIVANYSGHTERLLESVGAQTVVEQPLSLEDALVAYIGRHGKKDLFSAGRVES